MILINFSHPLTSGHIAQVETIVSQTVERVIAQPVQFDNRQPFILQLRVLMEQLPLTAEELQTLPILVNLPSLNTITALVLAELHGRMGYFPPILRLRPVTSAMPPRFEVAEIINLQNVREDARKER